MWPNYLFVFNIEEPHMRAPATVILAAMLACTTLSPAGAAPIEPAGPNKFFIGADQPSKPFRTPTLTEMSKFRAEVEAVADAVLEQTVLAAFNLGRGPDTSLAAIDVLEAVAKSTRNCTDPEAALANLYLTAAFNRHDTRQPLVATLAQMPNPKNIDALVGILGKVVWDRSCPMGYAALTPAPAAKAHPKSKPD